jgi:hypothetical protein
VHARPEQVRARGRGMANTERDRTKEPFDDPTGLTRTTQWSLYILGALVLASIATALFERNLLTRTLAGEGVLELAEMSDTVMTGLAFAVVAAWIFSAVYSLRFIYRANLNAQRLGADLEYSPGWAVGYYFIPILNIWKPYQAMREIWQASESPRNWQRMDRPGLLPAWWALWLLAGFIDNAAARLALRGGDDLDGLLTTNAVSIVSDLVWVPLIILFYILITRIYRMQMEHAAVSAFD